jgi:uncharacterized protein
MRVRVADIPEDGLSIDGAEAFEHPYHDPAWRLDDASLQVEKDGDAVLVHGRLAATVPQVCGRCLVPFDVRVTPEVDTRFVPSPRGRGEEHELAADELETDVYDNGMLDLDALLETETTLALPMKPLCQEGCRGLCPVCGANWNTTTCACEQQAPDSRWEPLKAWAARHSR